MLLFVISAVFIWWVLSDLQRLLLCRETAAFVSGCCCCCFSVSRKLLFGVATWEVSRRGGRIWHRRCGRSSPESVSSASGLGRPTRTDAMSVSFDAIRTVLDAIWRPIAALRPTRCRRRQNSTRITQQLGKHIGLYRQSAPVTDRWFVTTFYWIQLQAISALQMKNRNLSMHWKERSVDWSRRHKTVS